MPLVVDPQTGALIDSEELNRKQNQQKNLEDINISYGIDTEDVVPEAEDNNEVSGAVAFAAGIGSGIIKVGEGVVSLGAELIDLGAGTDLAADVEMFFDKINIFEETAQSRAVGKLTEALVQIGIPGGAGAKLATTLASKAVRAKKAGKYVNFKADNFKKGFKKTKDLNKLSGTQRFAAIVAGGAAGETLVADVENIGTFGDLFQGGPTELDRDVRSDPSDDAARKLANRLRFGSESVFLTPFVYGVGLGAKTLAKRGKELAYSNSQMEKALDKLASAFRFRGAKPQEVAEAKQLQKGRGMRDTNFAEEQVARIDKEVDKVFPEFRKVFNASTAEERKSFLKTLDDALFTGDLTKPVDRNIIQKIKRTVNKRLGAVKGNEVTNNIFTALGKTRGEFNALLEITAQGPGAKADLPAGVTRDLRKIMGNRVKNYIGNTFEIFENAESGFFSKYTPTQDAIDRVKRIFMRYARKNKNPITDLEAEGMVNDIIKGVRKMNPGKDTLPTFAYQDLSASAKDPFALKTFAQTIEKKLPGGKKEIKVIGKGSKAFRELFGEIEDVRHSIFEGMNRLSVVARKNQLFDEILDVDDAMKAKATPNTPVGQRGFFHSTPLAAKRAFGPNADIVKMDDYVQEYFKDGVLINRLSNTYTTKDIAEGFTNVSQVQNFMRGDSGGLLGKTFSWTWRNLLLTPKAGAQYAKTILSVPTHIRNFLSSSAFSLANGVVFTNPKVFAKAMSNAFGMVQVGGPRKPLSQEKYREYLELGVVNTNVRLGDLRNLMKDIRFGEGNIATDSVLRPMLNTLGKRVSRGVKKAGKLMQDLYVAEDDIWKIINYETQLIQRAEKYAAAGVKNMGVDSPALKREVARIVQDTVPNYAKVGEFVRAARVSPFGNFMSWPSEIFRTGYGIFEQGLKDLKTPGFRALGVKRLAGMTIAAGVLPYGLVKGSQAIFGVSNEEADAANDFVAPWAKSSQKIYFRDPETDDLFYIDWSKNNVYDTLTRPFQSVLRNIQEGIMDDEVLIKGFVQGIAEAAGETASPFISESIYTEAFMDIWGREGRTREGKQLYTEQTPGPEKIAIIMQHLGKTLLPTTQPFQRTKKAITGEPGRGSELYEIPYELAGIFGFRGIKVNPEKSMAFKLFEYQKAVSDSRRLFTGEIDVTEMRTASDVIRRYFIANKQIFNARKKMLNTMNNADTIGMAPDKMYEIFDKRGLKSEYDELSSGIFDPFFPSQRLEDVFDENARKAGIPNVYLEAEPTLRAIQSAMDQLTLYDDFYLNVEDFLPDTDPQGQSALPVTPQVSSQALATNNIPVTQTGLTPTEQALLSPQEQQIRLRQRGLA